MDLVFEAAKRVPLVALSLLPIMNPLSTIPLFLTLTHRMSVEQRRRQALRASIYAFAILATFLLFGNGVIALFGISLAGIRVAGGLIILVLAFRMLFSGTSEGDATDTAPRAVESADMDFSFSPLAMPSLAGAGSIAVVMGYGAHIPEQHQFLGHLVVIIGIAITAAIAYGALIGGNWISKFLGNSGLQAVTKIMGFLLTCVAVQFIASGVREFVTSLD